MELNAQIIGIVVVLLFTLFFAGIQTAFITVNRLNVELRKQQGKPSGKILNFFIERPFRLLSVTGLGLTISIVLYGILFQVLMRESVWNPIKLNNDFLSSAFNFIIELLVLLFFGTFLSRLIFSRNDRILYFFAHVLNFFDSLFNPLISALTALSKSILIYLFNIKSTDIERVLTPSMSDQLFKSQRENMLGVKLQSKINTSLFENALALANVTVRQCMIPRTEIVAIPIERPIKEVQEKFIESKLSKLIVYEKNYDNIQGYVHQLDLFKKPKDLKSILLPIFVVPETMSAIDLMAKFSKERKSMAWVIDEYGGTSGIITMEDIQEQIFGDIQDENEASVMVEKQLSEEEYVFSGRAELAYLNKKYDFDLPEDAETLSGYIINHFNAIPSEREHIIIGHYAFDILAVNNRKIDTVKMRILR